MTRKMTVVHVLSADDDYHPTTPADFGCRLWEAEEVKHGSTP